MTGGDDLNLLMTEIDRQLHLLSTMVRTIDVPLPENVVISLSEEGNEYRNDLNRLRKVVLDLLNGGASIGCKKDQVPADFSTFLWKIPTFSSSPRSFMQPEVTLRKENARCSVRRQGNDAVEPTLDLGVHPALLTWASQKRSSIIVVHGSAQSTNSLGHLGCEIVNFLLSQKYATIYILNNEDIRETFKSLGVSELLRQISCQLLRIVTTDMTISLLVEILRLSQSASTVKDWFCILERMMQKLASLFIVIDASVLQNLAKEAGQWVVEFNDIFRRLADSSTACIKIMILTNRKVEIASKECLHAHIGSIIIEGPSAGTPKLAASRRSVKHSLEFFVPMPTQIEHANNGKRSLHHSHDCAEDTDQLRKPLQYGGQFHEERMLHSSIMPEQDDILPLTLGSTTEKISSSSSNLPGASDTSQQFLTMSSLNYQRRQQVNVAVICALSWEADAVEVLCDHTYDIHEFGNAPGDSNIYKIVQIGRHKVVILFMPAMGKTNAAASGMNCLHSFPNIRLALLTGICGGIPSPYTNAEILLGDVIVSDRLVLYDFGRRFPEGFERKDSTLDNARKPLPSITAFLSKLKTRVGSERLSMKMASHLNWLRNQSRHGQWATYPGISNDISFEATYRHKHYNGKCKECEKSVRGSCAAAREAHCALLGCDRQRTISRKRPLAALHNPKDAHLVEPAIHFGAYASGDIVMKSGEDRDEIGRREKVIAFEMEGAGIWDNMPTIIVKGVCDYADSHKNKDWQKYAATTAAACVKALLEDWPSQPQGL